MDLISRKAALELLGELHPLDHNAIAHVQKIIALPSVPAVPLDKVCKFLSNEIRACPANPDGPNEYCAFDRCEECWKDAIRRRMEETDA